jgi:hypothetical protein
MNMDSTMPPPAGPEPGTLSRMLGVFFSPARTFESIARKPAFLIPVAFILLWTVFAGFIISSHLDSQAIVEKAMKQQEKSAGRELTADERARMTKGTEFFVKLSPVIGLCFVAIVLFLVPGIYHGLAAAWGKATRYTAVLSMYAHVQMIQVVKGVLLVLVTMSKGKVDAASMGTLLKSNIGSFLDPETSNAALRAILTNVDLFDLWSLILCVIGLSKVTKLTTKQAAFVVIGVWLAYVLVSAGFAAMGAAFGG